jgi:hypothetical protein
MRRRTLWTLIALVAVSVFLFLLVPPAPTAIDTAGWDALAARTVAGAYHVHTSRSDGHGDTAAVAAAAARAGLRFVILTDHGDGTRPPDPPRYLDDVLVLDAVEISTDGGHYVALDMPRAPYPLGGAADAVVEDVHRLGGFGIAAHPDSAKAALRWSDTAAPIDGIEWLNADSEWRDETRPRLVRAGLGYLFRPAAALATLLDRPATLDRWDALLRDRPVVALAGADAHGGGPQRRIEDNDQGRTLFSAVGIPSYEASFRELTTRVVLDAPLSRDAARDARAIYDAIRAGRVFTAIDALAAPALLDFHTRTEGGTITLDARAPLPPGAELVLIGGGREVARARGPISHPVPANGPEAYRVEVRLPAAPGDPAVPWLVSNAIRTGPSAAAPPPQPSAAEVVPGDIAPFPWRIEKDPASSAILRTSATTATLEYALAGGARASQYVAMASDVDHQKFSALHFGLSASRPSRVSVQVRNAAGERWCRSFYVDPAGSTIDAPLSALRPVGGARGAAPPSTAITSILLVVDLTNAAPGRSGSLRVLASALVK